MQEISLNILDIVQNSITAKATLIQITINIEGDYLTINVKDNGKGMCEETVENVQNPFFTTRTSRKVGLGIPFFKQAAEQTGGSFYIQSKVNVGTVVNATFNTKHIDYTPMGAIWETITALIQLNPDIQFIYTAKNNDNIFICDTDEIKEIMGDIPLTELKVLQWLKEYIKENSNEIFNKEI